MRLWWRKHISGNRRLVPQPSLAAAWGGLLVLAATSGCALTHRLMVVKTAVVDLRAQPHTSAQPGAHDPLEETQLLYGEPVRLVKTQDGWAYVEAVEQTEFTHAQRWQGYPGWLPAESLVRQHEWMAPNIVVTEKWAPTSEDAFGARPSPWRFPLGTRLRATKVGGEFWKVALLDASTVWMPARAGRPLEELKRLPPSEKRRMILRNAEHFIGDTYYWGGRSPQAAGRAATVTGVDCSGLVNLAYRAAGVDLPRDAHEQFLRARPVRTLQPADLIFLSERGNPKHIVHVMLYTGDDEIVEGPGTGLAVRRITAVERFGRPLSALAPGDVVDGQNVFFGTYLP